MGVSSYPPWLKHEPSRIRPKCWERSYRRRQKSVKRRRLKPSEPVESAACYPKTNAAVEKSGERPESIYKPDIVRTTTSVGRCLSACCFRTHAPVSFLLRAHAANLFQRSVVN